MSLFSHSFILFTLIVCIYTQNIHRRFEYKYSFKGPYLAKKDNQVPFWAYSGHAIASEESLRITPSLRSQKGQAWTKNPIEFEWWEVEFVFRVNGRGRIGADGLAFWYTKNPGVEGPVFGSSDQWDGLGLFFDSFDNDNKRNNPYVMGMGNDGTIVYDHEHDGASQQLGGCLRDFRNKPFPIRAKVEYYMKVLTVFINNGMTNNEKDYEICFRAENVVLPSTGYFGVSAATGGLADDHDVIKFLTFSLRSPEEMAQLIMNEEEEERFRKEFEEYQQKTQKAKDDYIAQNPDAAAARPDQEYETSEQRELRQIFQGQAHTFEVLKQLHVKVDDLVGRQERTLSLISAAQTGSGVQIPQQGGGAGMGATGGGASPIARHEVDAILANQRDLVQNSRDIKSYVSDIHQKSQQLLSKASSGATGSAQPVGGGGGGYDFHTTLRELNEGLNIIKRDLGVVNQRLSLAPSGGGGPGVCPDGGCVKLPLLLLFMVLQLAIILGYLMWRDSKEAQAKKFY